MKGKKPHKTIRQLLDEAGLQPTNSDWEKMQTMLDKQLPVSGKTNPFTSWHTWLITTGVVITGIVGYFLVKNINTGKKDTAIHQTKQVQSVNKPDAVKDSAAIFLGKEVKSAPANQQPDVAGGTLNDTHKPGTGTDANATGDHTSTSPVTNGNSSANNTAQQPNKTSVSDNNTSNQNNLGKQIPQHISTATGNSKQTDNTDLVVSHHTANAAKNNTMNKGKNNRVPRQNSAAIINDKLQRPSYTKEKKPISSAVSDNQNSNNKQAIVKNNKTNNALAIGIDTAVESPSLNKQKVDNNTPGITKQSIKQTADSPQNITAQNQASAKNEVRKNKSRRDSGSQSGSNAASNNSGFAAGLQLSPLQLNLNGSNKVDINYIPALHAQYSFNRIGVGVTVFPFVSNSTSQDEFYTNTDTIYSTDTNSWHRTITINKYYAQKITSYKAAVNVGYQLSDKILLEAGVGMQHLTSLKVRLHQDIQRDSILGLITSNSTVKLKSTDSVFKQSTQNTGFFFFNVWYTVKQWQFGVGYTQNGKPWLENSNNKGASQLQLNIRYLFDFRKKK
jgi:hypothetical protein